MTELAFRGAVFANFSLILGFSSLLSTCHYPSLSGLFAYPVAL